MLSCSAWLLFGVALADSAQGGSTCPEAGTEVEALVQAIDDVFEARPLERDLPPIRSFYKDNQGAHLEYRFISDPKPWSAAKHSDKTSQLDMVRLSLPTPGSDSEVVIYGYPISEDHWVSGALHEGGSWEGEHVRKLYDIFTKHDFAGNFLDVGGNIGTFTLPLARALHGKSSVISVEGLPSIAAHLEEGILANQLEDSVLLFEYALSDAQSDDTLTMSENPTNKGGSTVTGNKEWSDGSGVENTVVRVTTLDAMRATAPELQKVLVAKFDIEGSEGRALRGAKQLLEETPPCYLMIELVPPWLERAGTSLESVIAILESAKYDTSPILGKNTYLLQQRDMKACADRVLRAA